MHGAFGWPSWLPVEVLLLGVGVSSTHFPADVNISIFFFHMKPLVLFTR